MVEAAGVEPDASRANKAHCGCQLRLHAIIRNVLSSYDLSLATNSFPRCGAHGAAAGTVNLITLR